MVSYRGYSVYTNNRRTNFGLSPEEKREPYIRLEETYRILHRVLYRDDLGDWNRDPFDRWTERGDGGTVRGPVGERDGGTMGDWGYSDSVKTVLSVRGTVHPDFNLNPILLLTFCVPVFESC